MSDTTHNTFTIGNSIYKMQFPSIRRGVRLSSELGVSAGSSLEDVDWSAVYGDESKMMRILRLVIVDDIDDDILDDMSAGDFSAAVMSFFTQVQRKQMSMGGGLEPLNSTIDEAESRLLAGLKSTPQSLPVAGEIQS